MRLTTILKEVTNNQRLMVNDEFEIEILDENLSETINNAFDELLTEALKKAGAEISTKDVFRVTQDEIVTKLKQAMDIASKKQDGKQYASIRWGKKGGAIQHYNLYAFSKADAEIKKINDSIKSKWALADECKMYTKKDRILPSNQVFIKIAPNNIPQLKNTCEEQKKYASAYDKAEVMRILIVDNIRTLTTNIKGTKKSYTVKDNEKSSEELERFMVQASKAKAKVRSELFNVLNALNIKHNKKLWSVDEERTYIQKKFTTTEFDQVFEKIKGQFSLVVEGWEDSKSVLIVSKIKLSAIAEGLSSYNTLKKGTPAENFKAPEEAKTAAAIKKAWTTEVNSILNNAINIIENHMSEVIDIKVGTVDITIQSEIKV